ncbi:MAG: hypothetical protein ABSE48_16320 [Verrucomicrobiota bacterium]|jgi:hypothetical protein
MKLNHAKVNRPRGRIIREFGEAKLVRQPDGKHELIGGSTAEVAEAKEWVSLFAHEIVFSRPGCTPTRKEYGHSEVISHRFRPA